MTISYHWPRRQKLFRLQDTHLFTRCVHELKLEVRFTQKPVNSSI